MRKNNNRSRNNKSNKNMSNKDIAKALKERENCNSTESEADSYNSKGNSKHFNDPDWYINSEQILKDAARIPYSIPVGTCFKRDGSLSLSSPVNLPAYDNAIPGLMVSYLMPMLGSTTHGSSAAVNVASNSLFQFIRSKISGSRHYEAVDVMIYMGAMDSLYCMLTWMTRLYATAYTYHQANKYLARALIEAQNVDFDDLITNLPQFRAMVNMELVKVRAMYLPSVLPIFKRHSWMFSHYFIEGDSEKDQIYFHAPAGYHYFMLDDDGKGALSSVNIAMPTTKFTVAYMIQMLRQMINPIFEREDFNIISGDMLKAYEGNVFTLTEIPDIATISLTNAPDVLLQFKNAKYKYVSGKGDSDPYSWYGNFFAYVQSNSHHLRMVGENDANKVALQNFMSVYSSNDNTATNYNATNVDLAMTVLNEWTKDTLLTTPSHDVEPVENMINTRLTLGFDVIEDTDAQAVDPYKINLMFFGSEWPVFYRLYTYHRNKSNGNITLFSRTYDRTLAMSSGLARVWCESQEPVRSAFKYLPELSLIIYDYVGGSYTDIWSPGRSIFEVDNYALISALTVEGLHSAAILGEYNIPNLSIGK